MKISIIGKFRFFISKLMPEEFKWFLVRNLPIFVNFTAKFFQGIEATWENDEHFKEFYKKNSKKIMLDKKRAYVVYCLSKNCLSLSGTYAELGVFRGGGLKLLSSTGNPSIGFDTFDGFPEMDNNINPYWKAGELKSGFEEVTKYLEDSNVQLVKGVFPDSTENIDLPNSFSLVHLDTDLYEGTMAGCEYFYDKMLPSGVILVDDYSFLSCPGVKQAIDEFFDSKPENPIPISTGQCMIIKQSI